MANFTQLAIQKIKDTASSLGKTVQQDVGNLGQQINNTVGSAGNYFNPTSNNGQNFWSTPVAQGMANYQASPVNKIFTPIAQNITSGFQAEQRLNTAINPLLRLTPQSNQQAVFNKVGVQPNYFKNQLGGDVGTIAKGRLDALGVLVDPIQPYLGAAVNTGIQGITNLVNKQPIGTNLAESAGQGFEFGARFGSLGKIVGGILAPLTSKLAPVQIENLSKFLNLNKTTGTPEQVAYISKNLPKWIVQNLSKTAVEDFVAGFGYGATNDARNISERVKNAVDNGLQFAGYGVGMKSLGYAGQVAVPVVKDFANSPQGQKIITKSEPLGTADQIKSANDRIAQILSEKGLSRESTALPGTIDILSKRDWRTEPDPQMQEAIKLAQYSKAASSGAVVNRPRIGAGLSTQDVGKEKQKALDTQAGLSVPQGGGGIKNDQYGVVPEWGTRNQYVADNPYRPQLDSMKKTGNYDTKIIQKADRWDMQQVLKDKPAFLNDGNLPITEITQFAKNNDLAFGQSADNTAIIGKTKADVQRVINAVDSGNQRELGLALGYQDLGKALSPSPQGITGVGEVKSPSSTISQEVPTGKIRTINTEQQPQVGADLTQPIIPSDTNTYLGQLKKSQDNARVVEKGGVISRVGGFLKDVKRKLVDSTAPIEDVLGEAQKKGGYKVLPKNDISLQIDRSIRSRELAGQFLKDNGMVDVIRQVPDINTLDQYLIAKHAPEVTTTTGRNAQADAKLVQDLAPTYEPFAQQVTAYGQKLLDYATETGLVDSKVADALKKQYPNYVPLNRIFSEIEKADIPQGVGGRGPASLSSQSVVQKLKGSERAIASPIESLLTKTVDAFSQGERNQAGQMLASYKDLPGNPFQLRELAKGETAKDTISYLDNGVKRTFETTPEIAQAAKFLDKRQLGFIGNILALPVRIARIGITGVNIPFVTSNVAKDQVTAMINSDHVLSTSIANPGVFLKSLWTAVGHGAEYDSWIRDAGGGTSFDISRSAPDVSIGQIRAGKNLGTKALYVATHPTEILRSIENVINRGEELTRLQQYTGTKEALLKEGRTPEDAAMLAAKASRENTVNFGRSGDWGKALNSVLLYVNAGIQGSRTLMRNLTTRPIQTAAKIALGVFVPVATVTAWNMADPQRKQAYNDIRDFEKENNLVIVPPNPQKDPITGKWNVIKIPFSQEIANLTIPVRKAIESLQGNNGATFGDIAAALLATGTSLNTQSAGALIGQFIPQAVKPPLESLLNKNLFSGTDIVPQYINGQMSKTLPASEQVYTNTSGTAREIGKLFNVSPLKVEQFIKSSLGGVGSQVLNASDTLQAKAGIIPQEQVGGQSILQGITQRFALATGGQELANLFDSVDKANNTGDITNLDMNQRAIGNGKMYYPDKTLNTKTGKYNITVKSVNSGNAVSTDQKLSTPSTFTYQDSSGTYHEIDVSKIVGMPSDTPYNKALKEDKAYGAVANILDNLPTDQQSQALSDLGISAEDASYYNIARQNNDLKNIYITDEISRVTAGSNNRADLLNYLISQRKVVNGDMVLADGVVTQLNKDGVISDSEATMLKNLTIKNGVKTQLSGRGKKVTIKKVTALPSSIKAPTPKIKTMAQLLAKSGKIRAKKQGFITKIKK